MIAPTPVRAPVTGAPPVYATTDGRGSVPLLTGRGSGTGVTVAGYVGS